MDVPILTLSGSPTEIGREHGKRLKSRIQKTVEFYRKVFRKSEQEILATASLYRNPISKAFPDLLEEMDGIAEGAEVDPRWIYALNARSEILTMFSNECTAIYHTQSGLLAQNWDWAAVLEELFVIMIISKPDGHKIIMLTEPGIVGKIGFNSQQLGVTLNFLYAPGKLDGIPIHIMLRALLECRTFEEGNQVISQHYQGKGGNIIWAHGDGRYVNIEFANTQYYQIESLKTQVHTNHYLVNDNLNREREKLESSLARYARANRLGQFISNEEDIVKILHDESGTLPICRPYIFDEELGDIGTITTIIMDLQHRKFRFTPGNPFDNDFMTIDLDDY